MFKQLTEVCKVECVAYCGEKNPTEKQVREEKLWHSGHVSKTIAFRAEGSS